MQLKSPYGWTPTILLFLIFGLLWRATVFLAHGPDVDGLPDHNRKYSPGSYCAFAQ